MIIGYLKYRQFMQKISQSLNFFAQALSIYDNRNKILASNIANAGTPHFKARDIDYMQEIRAAAGYGKLSTSHDRHISISGGSQAPAKYRLPVNSALDGNTVELNVEQVEFSKTTMRYQTSLNFLNGRISTLTAAIRGES